MSYYTERPELTKHIWQQLQQDPGKGTVSLVGLRGMGGVGKTTLALEAIHYPKQHYHFRGWFKAETSELLKTDYLDLGAKMHLFTQQMNDKQKLIAVKEWLEAQPSILLVYDNAPDMSTLRDHLPNRGHILITSRNQRMPHPIDIEGMQESEAMQLLDKLIPKSLKQEAYYRDHLKTLAKELGSLPLALSQAGAYMTEHQLSIPDYLKRYRGLQAQLLAQRTLPPQDPHEPVYVTWDMNLQAIRQHPQGQQAIRLLDAIAHLYPEDIPKALLAQYLFQATDDAAITRLDNAIGLLKTYSLVKSSGNDISIHRLVHAHLQHQDSDKSTVHQDVVHSIATMHQVTPWDHMLFKSMIPHAEYLKTHGTSWLTAPQRLQLDMSLGWMYTLSGRFTQAKELSEQILPTSIQLHGESSRQTTEIYYSMGWIYRELGQPLEAQIRFEKSLSIYQQLKEKRYRQLAQIYQGLGWVCRDLGQLLETKNWLEKALFIVQKHHGEQHGQTARIYRGLGWVYRELGQPLQAKAWFEKALSIVQRYCGEQDVQTARIYRGLGWVYRELGQPIKAKAWIEKTLSIVQKHYGQQHVRTGRVYQGLGWIYHDLGDPIRAKAWINQALAIFKQHYGPNHIWTAPAYQSLGWIEIDLNQPEQAKQWFEKAFTAYQIHYNREHPWMVQVYDGLGWSELKLGLLDQAQSWFKQALAVHQKHHHEMHTWSLPTHHGLAWVYLKLGQLESSQSHLEQAQQIIQQHQQQGYQFNQKLHQSLTQLQQMLVTTHAKTEYAPS